MIVMKFGGTSVGSSDAMRRVGQIIEGRLDRTPVVVLSATSKTTDELLSLVSRADKGDSRGVQELVEWIVVKHRKIGADLGLGRELLEQMLDVVETNLSRLGRKILDRGEADREVVDDVLCQGEFLSCNLVDHYLRRIGIRSAWADARKVVLTDSKFGRARPLEKEAQSRVREHLNPLLETETVPIIQGFIGADRQGRTTTLGRGGSDFSATFLGGALGAECVEIWTDVDGILTADPSLVPQARRIREMTFEEAAELAYFGAKVLHPSTIRPAVERGIPVFVLNSTSPDQYGTRIMTASDSGAAAPMIKSIAYKEGLSVLDIKSTRMLMAYGFLSTIFEIFNQYETSVDLVATSEVSVSVTIDNLEHLPQIMDSLREFAEVEVRHGKAIVCCVGENICREPGMPARVFSELEGIEITLISQGASKINISFVIDDGDLPEVVSRLHKKFFSGELDGRVFAV